MNFLDYASTCPVVKYPQQLYRNVLGEGYFFNPNANYAYKEKRLLSEAENKVKKAIGAKGGKIIFGGTSSQLIENLMVAIDEQTNYCHIICSAFEHDSFFRHGNVIGYSKKDLLNKLQIAKEYVTEAQKFVVWQGVNNLTGEIFPITEIGNACHEHDTSHICDMTAMIGKIPIPTNIDQWCDCAVWSGHKLGTELGIGAMWVSDRLDKWLNGFKLHGTPNLVGALAMAQAVEDACDSRSLDERTIRYNELQNYLIGYLVGANIDFQLVPEYDEQPSGHEFISAINTIRLPGIDVNALQQYLASKRIYIGVGHSSCADNKDFRILQYGYGLSEKEASEVIRISFGENSNETDILALAQGVKEFKEKFV